MSFFIGSRIQRDAGHSGDNENTKDTLFTVEPIWNLLENE